MRAMRGPFLYPVSQIRDAKRRESRKWLIGQPVSFVGAAPRGSYTRCALPARNTSPLSFIPLFSATRRGGRFFARDHADDPASVDFFESITHAADGGFGSIPAISLMLCDVVDESDSDSTIPVIA